MKSVQNSTTIKGRDIAANMTPQHTHTLKHKKELG